MPHSQDKTITQIAVLLSRYGFELNGVPIPRLIKDWLGNYSVYWIRLGIIEALFQGRYKVISIERILMLWQRRGKVTYHFSYDFERLITEKLIIEDWTDTLRETDSFRQKYLVQQFIPNRDSSEFYEKLRAVAHQVDNRRNP